MTQKNLDIISYILIDVAFDILDNNCLYIPTGIRTILKEYLEPIYIKPEFNDWPEEGRCAWTTMYIWEDNQW